MGRLRAYADVRFGAFGLRALTYRPLPREEHFSPWQCDPAKLQFTIDAICEAYSLATKPAPADVYTEKFLPPLAERMLSKT